MFCRKTENSQNYGLQKHGMPQLPWFFVDHISSCRIYILPLRMVRMTYLPPYPPPLQPLFMYAIWESINHVIYLDKCPSNSHVFQNHLSMAPNTRKKKQFFKLLWVSNLSVFEFLGCWAEILRACDWYLFAQWLLPNRIAIGAWLSRDYHRNTGPIDSNRKTMEARRHPKQIKNLQNGLIIFPE